MRKLFALCSSALIFFSCGSTGYLASEYSSRSILAGKPTVKPVNAPLKTQATTQLGTSIAVNLVGGAILGRFADSVEREYLRKYYAICMVENGLKKENEEYCSNWAREKWNEVMDFKHRLDYGKCTEKWFGIFKGFRRCYKEAVDGVKDLHSDWDREVWKILYYDKLSDCIPDPADVKTNKEFLDKYSSCKVKAEKYADKEYVKIMEKAGYKDRIRLSEVRSGQ